MTDKPQEPQAPATESVDYRDLRLAELEQELATSLARNEQLTRRVGQLNGMITNMGRAAQVARVTRLGIRRPKTLIRLPVDLVRAVTHPVLPAAPSTPDASPAEAERHRARERQLAAAVRTVERRQAAPGARDVSTLRVAFVGDEALRLGLAPECDLVALDALDWRPALEAQPPDVLLVQSAWRGRGGSWAYRIAWYPHPDSYRLAHLRALVDWCRERSIPTVFWSTEDPVQVERFAAASALFDHVLTVDPGSVARLTAEPRRSSVRVGHLPLAVQPRLHHPSALPTEGVPAVFIGAAYRGVPYLEREALARLLDAAARVGLEIRDRQLGADERLFGFEERHRAHIGPWLPTAEVPAAIRAHRVVVGEPSTAVVPVRVLEAIASGRPVVSLAGSAAADAWPGAVLAGATDAELDQAFAMAIDDDPAAGTDVARAAVGILTTATYRQRLAAIARTAGIEVAHPAPGCALVALADDAPAAHAVLRTADTLGDRVTEVVLGTRDAGVVGTRERLLSAARVPVRIVLQAGDADEMRHQHLAATVDAPWVHVADPARPVSAEALTAQLAAVQYAAADVVGAPLDGQPQWTATTAVDAASAIVRRSALLARGWRLDPVASASAMADWARDGASLYATTALGERRA